MSTVSAWCFHRVQPEVMLSTKNQPNITSFSQLAAELASNEASALPKGHDRQGRGAGAAATSEKRT